LLLLVTLTEPTLWTVAPLIMAAVGSLGLIVGNCLAASWSIFRANERARRALPGACNSPWAESSAALPAVVVLARTLPGGGLLAAGVR
jgi:hypothetical protein